MSSRDIHPDVPRRKALFVAVSALCAEAGFGKAENTAIETMTEMLQSYITELGKSAQGFAELAGRTEPMCSDVVMALVEMGADVQKLPAYARRPNKSVFMPPKLSSQSVPPRQLQAGSKQGHPSHIPDYLPTFPDPHTYIKTQTYKKPVTEYQIIREKAASQKRDVERALTRFMAKTGETEKLFEDDPYAYPLIACKPTELPYLDTLLPKDEDLEAQEEEEKRNKKIQEEKQEAANRKQEEKEAAEKAKESEITEETKKDGEENKDGSKASGSQEGQAAAAEGSETEPVIDNPYLRPIKMPKLKGGKTKSKW